MDENTIQNNKKLLEKAFGSGKISEKYYRNRLNGLEEKLEELKKENKKNENPDIYKLTKEWLSKGNLECGKCGIVGKVGKEFIIYDNDPRNIAVYFRCQNCKEKYFSSMPGHFEPSKFQVLSSPALSALRFLNKIFK